MISLSDSVGTAPTVTVQVASACTDASSSPTRSLTLSAWPDFTAAIGPDLTASAGVVTTAVGGPPAGIVVTPDGNWVFASVQGVGLVALKRQGTFLTVDHSFAPPGGTSVFGLAISHDGTKLAMGAGNEVVLYDLANAEANAAGALIAAVPDNSATSSTLDVTFSGDDAFVFAALEYDHAVAAIDVTTQAYVGSIPIAGSAVTSVAASPDGQRLYVVCEAANGSPNGGTDQIIGLVTVVDANAARTTPATAVLGTAYVGRAPVRALVSSDGATLWITARGSYDLVALDATNILTACDPLRSTTAVGPAPVGLAFVGGGQGVAVANSNRFLGPNSDQTVMILDTARALAGGINGSAIVAMITVGEFPREISADSTALFVTNYNSHSISSIDLTSLPAP